LTNKRGIRWVTIHGGNRWKNEELAQSEFARNAQILIGTNAAGEGITYSFAVILINWDIPWNPNRLEQRMGVFTLRTKDRM
jgi:superfamily II DNA/RNA helicase